MKYSSVEPARIERTAKISELTNKSIVVILEGDRNLC
jgi:hypothetical protein